jgi:hypothetical protein
VKGTRWPWTVVEHDSTSDPATGRVGSWLWDSSLVLAAYFTADSPARCHICGATAVELSAGMRLLGIAATVCLGAAHCVLADVVALLSGLKANTVANRVSAAGPTCAL